MVDSKSRPRSSSPVPAAQPGWRLNQRSRCLRSLRLWLCGLGSLAGMLTAVSVAALDNSVGETGIDAYRLHQPPYSLTGRKIGIGQVEVGRPAQIGFDKVASTNAVIRPDRLFVRNNSAQPNDFVDQHASRVASIMISRDKRRTGVAPNAKLYSSAIGNDPNSGQPQECLAAQTVAAQNGGDVRAINFSFGESLSRDPRPKPVLDGNALLTQCVDWSTRVHNALYVISGNQGRGGFPIPTDTFNGMTIANSMAINGRLYNKVDFFSLGSEPTVVIGRDPADERNVGPRRSVTLVAPGRAMATFKPDGTIAPPDTGGTSFAAPHVTGTVALLQELGDRMIRQARQVSNPQSLPQWTLDARQAEVMKAVLMNSADKIQDRGDGMLLGMSRTLLNIPNRSWLESDAYRDPKIPLDAQMGTGHLNAYRAYQQFSPGQWAPSAPVPAIGWDYRRVGLTPDESPYQDYVLEPQLQGGSFISVTLAWNRLVELQDRNRNQLFDEAESFVDRGLNNLDIYLMPADATDPGQSVWSSISSVDSVEHIFHQIPVTGRYKIRVVFRNPVNEPVQLYALAWWAIPVE
ncbi:MAG: S8 family serine peptidase [Elainella sp.]